MKYILVPIRVFETGDRVYSSEGLATVIHDEMEGFDDAHRSSLSCSLESKGIERARQSALMRQGVIIRLDEPTSKHTNVEEDLVDGRDHLILLDIYKERPKTCPRCGSNAFEDESTAHFAQRLWSCRAPQKPGHGRGCGEMFLVDPNKKDKHE